MKAKRSRQSQDLLRELLQEHLAESPELDGLRHHLAEAKFWRRMSWIGVTTTAVVVLFAAWLNFVIAHVLLYGLTCAFAWICSLWNIVRSLRQGRNEALLWIGIAGSMFAALLTLDFVSWLQVLIRAPTLRASTPAEWVLMASDIAAYSAGALAAFALFQCHLRSALRWAQGYFCLAIVYWTWLLFALPHDRGIALTIAETWPEPPMMGCISDDPIVCYGVMVYVMYGCCLLVSSMIARRPEPSARTVSFWLGVAVGFYGWLGPWLLQTDLVNRGLLAWLPFAVIWVALLRERGARSV
ncbi:MAG: hypothetical protein KC766_12055 [Myxococcales bacterium]|nr:hypothetical protein [Planctomycetota bacterium]MCA9628397.1 hypothetical protein [Myxococcales bacterium]